MEKNIRVYMYSVKYVLIQRSHSNPPEGSRCTKYVEFSFTENVKKLKNHTSFVMTIYGCIPPSPSNPTHTLFLRHEVHIRSSQIDINVNNPKYLHNADNQRSSQNFFLIYKCTTCVDSMQVHGKLHAS